MIESTIWTSEAAALEEIKRVVAEHDQSARVFVYGRKFLAANAARDVSFAVIVPPDSFAVIDALVDLCVASNGVFKLVESEVNMAGDVDVDVIQIMTRIYRRQ